jgi:hypothetical protein
LPPVGDLADRGLATYWAVQACGAYRCGPLTQPKSFTKAWKNTVQSVGVSADGSMRTFTWNTMFSTSKPAGSLVPFSPEAKAYEVQVDEIGGDFATPIKKIVTDRVGNTTGKAWWRSPTAALPSQFSWRVRGISQSGFPMPWSTPQHHDVVRPVASISTAAGFALTAPLTLTFSEPVKNVSSSTLKVLPYNSVTPVAGTLTKPVGDAVAVHATAPWVAGQRYLVSAPGRDRPHRQPGRLLDGVRPRGDHGRQRSPALSRSPVTRLGDSDGQRRGLGQLRPLERHPATTPGPTSDHDGGHEVVLYACKSPVSGRAGVYIDGTLRGVVDLYRSYNGCWSRGPARRSSGHAHRCDHGTRHA